ncbi:hypothetical protein [Tolypothrix sp. NIES-4075]|uniref:hypothetical protein n=1 Tax=Tolypothrix sp. NIES-4075 TaxID=2005459 RepID=UPI001180E136|nr:hypothetical protein [Tolypothrix sp. NIES-4075]
MKTRISRCKPHEKLIWALPNDGRCAQQNGSRYNAFNQRNALPRKPPQRTASPMPDARCPMPQSQVKLLRD